jgi:hypothetical protein
MLITEFPRKLVNLGPFLDSRFSYLRADLLKCQTVFFIVFFFPVYPPIPVNSRTTFPKT